MNSILGVPSTQAFCLLVLMMCITLLTSELASVPHLPSAEAVSSRTPSHPSKFFPMNAFSRSSGAYMVVKSGAPLPVYPRNGF